MSKTIYPTDDFYQKYQDTIPFQRIQRKGKYMEIHNQKNKYKVICNWKKKNKISKNTRVSEYDIYKNKVSKKHTKRQVKSVRRIGHDYKEFVNSNLSIEQAEKISFQYLNVNSEPDYLEDFNDYYGYWDDDDWEYKRNRYYEWENRWEDRRKRRMEKEIFISKYYW